jgi:DNA anti-recombination protein RmuC
MEESRSNPSDSNRRRVESLQSQIATARRLQEVTRDTAEQLRLLDARLDEAVARAVELSLSGDSGKLTGLDSDVDDLVAEMEALRQALEETGGGTAQMGVT